ncbi:MAG: 4Fe-4S binding protein, partial [Synergistaceae bacterium]|nr:4Fe-4S binding protein [Synergistaceae bacterium]
MFGGKLAGIFFTDTIPVLNESSCLNRRNRFEPCCLCRKACNYAALTIEAGFPVIDEKKCMSCGLCASVCPSEALRLKDYQIFRRLSGDDELKCIKSGGIYCLKALSPALIASIIVMKPDITFVMPCSNCEL